MTKTKEKEFKLKVYGCRCSGRFYDIDAIFTVTAEDEESAREKLANGDYDVVDPIDGSINDYEIDDFDLDSSNADMADVIE